MAKAEKGKEKKEVPKTLKGMRDIIGDELHKYQGFSEKAAEVAIYYGFSPIDTPILEHEEVFFEHQQRGHRYGWKRNVHPKDKGW
jgi:histidyl-tRNA synthetase